MASQQAYPSATPDQQAYPVPPPAASTTTSLVTVLGGREFVMEGRTVINVPNCTSVEKI
jgi:hypothetical protein